MELGWLVRDSIYNLDEMLQQLWGTWDALLGSPFPRVTITNLVRHLQVSPSRKGSLYFQDCASLVRTAKEAYETLSGPPPFESEQIAEIKQVLPQAAQTAIGVQECMVVQGDVHPILSYKQLLLICQHVDKSYRDKAQTRTGRAAANYGMGAETSQTPGGQGGRGDRGGRGGRGFRGRGRYSGRGRANYQQGGNRRCFGCGRAGHGVLQCRQITEQRRAQWAADLQKARDARLQAFDAEVQARQQTEDAAEPMEVEGSEEAGLEGGIEK